MLEAEINAGKVENLFAIGVLGDEGDVPFGGFDIFDKKLGRLIDHRLVWYPHRRSGAAMVGFSIGSGAALCGHLRRSPILVRCPLNPGQTFVSPTELRLKRPCRLTSNSDSHCMFLALATNTHSSNGTNHAVIRGYHPGANRGQKHGTARGAPEEPVCLAAMVLTSGGKSCGKSCLPLASPWW